MPDVKADIAESNDGVVHDKSMRSKRLGVASYSQFARAVRAKQRLEERRGWES